MPSKIWLDHVANGEAFSAENFLIPGGGFFGHIQLFNPVASGVRVRLRTSHMISSAALGGTFATHNTALTTLGLPAGFIVENLLGGGPAAAAEMRSAALVAAAGILRWQVNGLASTPAVYPPEGREWGFDLLEGQGVMFYGGSGSVIIVNWQWVEVPL